MLNQDRIQTILATHGLLPMAGAETPPAAPEAPAAPAEGAESGAAAAAAPGADLTAIETRMDEVMGAIGQVAERLPAPEPQPDPTDQAVAARLEQMFGPAPAAQPPAAEGAPAQPGAEENFLQEMINQGVDTRTREALKPLLTEIESDRRERETTRRSDQAAELVSEYPEMKDPNTARAIVSEAQNWAKDMGNPALAGEPAFVELVLLAAKTAERAAGETPAAGQPGAASLESGSGANPGVAAVPEAERAQRIVDAGKHNSFWM